MTIEVDVTRRAHLVEESIREDEPNGWTYVHDAGDESEDPATDER